MRTIPELSFYYDNTEDRAEKVDTLLASVKDKYDGEDDDYDEDIDLDDYLDDEDYFDIDEEDEIYEDLIDEDEDEEEDK